MTHTLDRDDTPPPMPLSWRMFGSGEPITERKIGSHSAHEAGRSRAWKTMALDVPPRMNTAGSFFCGMDHLVSGIRISIPRQAVELAYEHVLPGRRLHLEQADAVHEIRVDHDPFGHKREAQIGVVNDAEDFALRRLHPGSAHVDLRGLNLVGGDELDGFLQRRP